MEETVQGRLDDETALTNTLSATGVWLHERGFPDYLHCSFPGFLKRSLTFNSPNVFLGGVTLLDGYLGKHGTDYIGRAMAEALLGCLLELPDAEITDVERSEIGRVTARLGSRAVAPFQKVRISQLDEVIDCLVGHEELTEFVLRTRLRFDARREAARGNMVLTTRIKSGRVGSLQRTIHEFFHLCQAAYSDSTRKTWLAAPAASLSEHARTGKVGVVEDAFDKLTVASNVASQVSGAEDALASIPGRQATLLADLVLTTTRENDQIELFLTDPFTAEERTCRIEPLRVRVASSLAQVERARTAASRRLEVYSEDIPQANTVRQVLQAVTALAKNGIVEVSDISNISTGRQVAYYLHGAKVLGLVDDDNVLTNLSARWGTLGQTERMRRATKGFEACRLAIAWAVWAGEPDVWQLSAGTALAFLSERAVGITGSTIPRRASTIRKWFAELSPRAG